MRNPSLRQLEALVAVIETGTVSSAAEVLGISQPAASKLIRDLEFDTQLELFERESGRLVPTGRGMRLYEEVARILSGVNQLARAVEGIRREERGQIIVGVFSALSGAFMARVLARFREVHPEVFIHVESRASLYLSEGVLLRRLDAAIVALPFEHPTIQSHPLHPDPMMCVMPKGHPLAAKQMITARDIGNTPFVSFGSTSQTRLKVEAALQAENEQLNIVVEADIAANVAEFVARGFGVTIGPPIFFETVLSRVELRPFLPVLTDDLRLLRPIRARNSMLVDTFVEAALHAAKSATD